MEPLGIQDMRFAKAEYIRALKDLRAADAELQRALAAVELANARYRDAETANLNADTEYQKLLNEYQQLINEARQDTNSVISQETASKIDSIKKAMELRELTHAKAMVDAEKALAQAKEELRVALRNISLAAGDLTGPEKVALAEAVAVYYGLTEEVIKQEYEVFKAQQKVDTLTEYALRFADTAWNGYALVGVDDYYEDAIAWEEAKILKWMEDYEAIPDSSARVAEWKAYVDKFADRVNQLDYELAKIDANETAITSLMKEGIRDFNMAIAEFIEENWNEKPAGTFTEPTEPAEPGAEPKASDYKANDYLSDSLAFSPFAKTKDISPETFNKFVYLLSSYNVDAPDTKADPKNKIMKTNTAADTLFIVGPVSQKSGKNMKSFILGAAGNGEESQTYKKIKANYGLWGAYDILEREMVTAKKSAADTADLRETMEEADSIWTAHRQILIDGLAAYEPYAEAIAKYEADVATNGAGATAMVAAIVEIKKQLDAVNGDANFASVTINDSTAIFDALVAFAKARENYLEYDTTAGPHNLNYLRFATGIYSGEPVVDSVKFSALSWDDFKAHKYDFAPDGDAPISGTSVSVASPLNQEDGLANIANQLLGTTIGGKFAYPLTTGAVTTTNFNTAALYGGQYTVDDYEDPTEILEGGSTYEPSNLADDRDAIKDAIDDYVDVYNSFWSLSVTADMSKYTEATTGYYDVVEAGKKAADIAKAKAAAEAQVIKAWPYDVDDVKGYTLATFKPYADEAPIVYYTNGSTIDKTTAMKAILTAVDPKSTDKTDNTQWDAGTFESKSAIFKDGATDFAAFMKASYDYYLATTTTLVQDLAVVKAWIEGVEATFASDEAAAPGKATKAYNDDHKDWETTKTNYDTKKAAYDEYVAAKKAFTGTRTVSGKTVINPVYNAAASYTKPITPAFLTDVKDLFATNLVGEYVGWIETLGGKQLENAIKAFGEKPWEQFNEWNAEKAQYTAQKTDLSGLKTKAETVFKAEAKMEGYDRVADAANFDAAYTAYVNAYNALRNAIVVYDEFGNIDMTNTTAKVNKAYQEIERLSHEAACYKSDIPDWEGLIAGAQKELKVQEARLQSLKAALEYAKTNYEKLKEYILSQDASYVIPVSVADIQSIVGGLTGLLDDLGINVGDLLSEYLGLGEEEVVEP